MRFRCCFNMGFNLILETSPDLFVWHYTGKHCCPDWSLRWIFCSRKLCMRYDEVMTFEGLMLMTFCLEKTSVRKWYFKVLVVFSESYWLESGKMCSNNDHTCLFHCINTCWVPRKLLKHEAVSRGSCLNMRLFPRKLFEHEAVPEEAVWTRGLMFKQLPLDPLNVNAWKYVWPV